MLPAVTIGEPAVQVTVGVVVEEVMIPWTDKVVLGEAFPMPTCPDGFIRIASAHEAPLKVQKAKLLAGPFVSAVIVPMTPLLSTPRITPALFAVEVVTTTTALLVPDMFAPCPVTTRGLVGDVAPMPTFPEFKIVTASLNPLFELNPIFTLEERRPSDVLRPKAIVVLIASVIANF